MLTIANPLQRRGINKLPFELLVEIFDLASVWRFLDEGQTVPPAHTLIELTHVCRTWRTVIRGKPRLWEIVCGVEPPAMMREIIVLSKEMPLSIMRVKEHRDDEDDEDGGVEHHDEDEGDETEEWHSIEDNRNYEEWHGIDWHHDEADELHGDEHLHGSSGSEADDESDDSDESEGGHDGYEDDDTFGVTPRDAAEIILAQLHRTKGLDISLNSEDAPALLPLLDADAPLLEYLTLSIVGGDAPVVVNPFGGTAPPHLTWLSLTGGCEISQASPVWKNLTHLELYSQSNDARQDPYHSDGGFVHLSSVLAQMSSLAELEMWSAIPPDICDFELTDIPAIDLPRLTSLSIGDFASKCVLFLAALKCQLDTLTVIAGEDDDHTDYERYETIYYYLFQMCQQQMAPVFGSNPVSHITLENKSYELILKGFRSQEGVLESAFGNPLTVDILHTQPSFVDEELVSRAISIVPSRQPDKLGVELKNMDGLNLTLVALGLHTLGGIPCTAINLHGHEVHWWGSLDLSATGDGGHLEDEE